MSILEETKRVSKKEEAFSQKATNASKQPVKRIARRLTVLVKVATGKMYADAVGKLPKDVDSLPVILE